MATINPCDFGTPQPCAPNPSYTYTRYPCDQDDPRQTDTKGLPVIVDLQTPVRAEMVNRHRESILAIEGELGIQPSGTYTTVRHRLDEMSTLMCGIWEVLNLGILKVLWDSQTVTNDVQVKEINFIGDGISVTQDANFAINGRVNVSINGGSDGYQPIHEVLTVATNGQTIFTLSTVPYENIALLFIGGLKQDFGHYTVVGQILTWLGTPSLITTDTVEVLFFRISDGNSGGSGGSGSGNINLDGYGIVADIAIEELVTLYLQPSSTDGYVTLIDTDPSPVILSLNCIAGSKVLLQLTPITYIDPQENEGIGLYISLRWEYSLNGTNWLAVSPVVDTFGSDTTTTLILATTSRVYTHSGVSGNVQFRIRITPEGSNGQGLSSTPKTFGTLIASRL